MEVRDKVRQQGFIYRVKGNACDNEGELEPWLRWDTVWSAARTGDPILLKRLLESDLTLVNSRNTNNETPLHFASRYGHVMCVALLVELGAESFASDRGQTPVQLATENAHTDVVKYLCGRNHLGTDLESAKRLLVTASSKTDFGTMAVLQAHIEPTVSNPEEEELRRNEPILRQEREEKVICELGETIRQQAILKEPEPLPPLPHHEEWTTEDVERWLCETFPDQTERMYVGAISRYHVTGEVLFALTKGEMTKLFQRIGFPSPFRTDIVQKLVELHGKPKRFGFSELRSLPVALGNASAFRIIGTVRAAMSTPLQTCRRFVTASTRLQDVPDQFLFNSMEDVLIPRNKEGERLVSHLGFVILLATLKDASDDDEE